MSNKQQNIVFVASAYLIFWLVLLAGISILFIGNEALFSKCVPYIRMIGTWAPTFALLIFFKKLCPAITVREFYRNAFRPRVNGMLILVFAAFSFLIVAGAAGIQAITSGSSFQSVFQLSLQALATGFIWSLVQGATGEESGWRGYLQPSVEKKHSVIKASLIVGIIWAGWHIPTWFVHSLAGKDLVLFILLDIVDKMTLAMIIGICYSRCRNLSIPIVFHFISNFFMVPIAGAFDNLHLWYTLLTLLVAVGYVAWHKKHSVGGGRTSRRHFYNEAL